MANYIIEGTITEIKKMGNDYKFKISGTEGYAIKQKNGKDDIKLNVLCSKDTAVVDNKKPRNAIIVSVDSEFPAKSDDILLLSTALGNGKRCKFEFSEKSGKTKDFDSNNCDVSSITILSD